MAKNKITFYNVSHGEYNKIIDFIKDDRNMEVEAGVIAGNPPSYSTVTICQVAQATEGSKPKKQIFKGLVNLLDD